MIADYIKDEVMAMKFINPPLVFRMSVTGHRDLGCNQLDAQKLRGKINLVLDVVKSLVATILKSDTAGIYNHSLPPVLRLASGLAAGADQLVADCAVTAGWRLEAVLPFTENEYLKDFDSPESPSQFGAMLGMPWSDDRTAFSALLKKATAEGTCIELCGPTEPPTLRNHSYVAVGKTLVRRSEILLAIWNESKEGGRGGTAEVVEFALRNRLPVIWIASGDCDRRRAEICWLTGVDDFYNALAGGDGVVMFDESKIGNYLHQLLLASCLDSKVADFYDRHVLFKDFRQDMESLLQRESLGGVQMPPYGKFFRWIRDWLYTPDSKYNTDYIWNSKRPYDFEEHFMYVNRIIDWQALTSGEIYRSTYTAIYLLGAMVAVVAMCSTAGFHKMLWIEFPLLIIISLLCLFDVRRNNYKRWIIYRLLAGLLGQSRWLARLGLELRIGRNDLKRDVHKSSGGWVLVYLQSMIRAAPSVCLCIRDDPKTKYLFLKQFSCCEDQHKA